MRSAIRTVVSGIVALGLTISASAQADRWAGDGGLPPFYSWTSALPSKPGKMLRTETAPVEVSIPEAGRAERILYSSTDWRDPARQVAVSGIIFFPAGKAPKGGWPVIAWAHGTTGIADVCAPSSMPRSKRDASFFGHWLKAGYAIVAADYQGLGSPGVHPYMHYKAEGIGVLDSIRAATSYYRDLSKDKIVAMGQSQGGEGAIATAYLAPSYAPDVKFKGAVATGIVARTANVGNAPQEPVPNLYLDDNDFGNSAYEVLWFLGTVRSGAPDSILPEDYVAPEGLSLVEKAQTSCMADLRRHATEIRLPVSRFYKQSLDKFDHLVATTEFPDVAMRVPIFVGTGLADRDSQPVKQYNFVSAMCAAGSKVEWHYYPRATHSSAVERSLAHSPNFVERVMKGEKIAGNCADLVPPGPLQEPE